MGDKGKIKILKVKKCGCKIFELIGVEGNPYIRCCNKHSKKVSKVLNYGE